MATARHGKDAEPEHDARDDRKPAQPDRLVGKQVESDEACRNQRNRQRKQSAVATARPLFLNVFVHVRNPLAGQEGIEPPTCGFGDRRSAN